jgi:hypothetical protein
MSANVGRADRAVRMTVGIMMSALGLSGVVAGAPGAVLITLGTALLVTGTVGRCLLYRALGWTTVEREA